MKLTAISITFFLYFSTVSKDFYVRLSDAAIGLTANKVAYDPRYYTIPYPNGDVPKGKAFAPM